MKLLSPSISGSERRVAPGRLVASLWAVALVLTVLELDAVRDWLAGEDRPAPSFVQFAAAPPAEAEPPPPTAAAEPQSLRLLLVGASSMQHDLGIALEEALEKRPGLVLHRFGKASTGLSRPDEFDWPAKLGRLLAELHPDVVIVNFGGNDATSIPLGRRRWAEFGTEEWDREYGQRVADMVRRARTAGARAVVIGMPIMRSARFSERMRRLNGVTQKAVEAAGGFYVDQWDLSSTPDGKYREVVTVDGRQRLFRHSDGIHYSMYGGRWVARRLVERLERLGIVLP